MAKRTKTTQEIIKALKQQGFKEEHETVNEIDFSKESEGLYIKIIQER